MTPDVSLIMPAWLPRADWLREAVASALDENACEVELIIVDDGSEVPVEPLLDGVSDPRMKVIRVEHAGPYAARNAGISVANGRFLRFVDCDDVVVSGSTGRLLALAEEDPIRIAYGATAICNEELVQHALFSSNRVGWAAEECVLGRFEVYVVAILFPNLVVDRAGPWEETAFSVSGDWDFVLRALEQAPVRPLNEVVTLYRRHSESITKTADVAAGAAAGRLVIGRYLERHPEQRGSELERRAYLRLHLDRAEAYAWVGHYRPAAAELAAAARRDRGATMAAVLRWFLSKLRGHLGRLRRYGAGN